MTESAEKPLIALGITGGIAAYKAAELCSMLTKAGFGVQVVMTANACRFVGELTFRTLSQRTVITDLWSVPDWRPGHVALATEAAMLAVAPCTANFIGKYAGGIADDALTTLAISMRRPVLLAPAMNPEMWSHPAVRENVATLQRRGVHFVGPAVGHVACGADGTGRMSEPGLIFAAISELTGA